MRNCASNIAPVALFIFIMSLFVNVGLAIAVLDADTKGDVSQLFAVLYYALVPSLCICLLSGVISGIAHRVATRSVE
jgi:hypothetical protein